MYFIYEIAKLVRKVIPYGLYCKIVGDSYSKSISKMKKDIWSNKELYALYKPEIDYMKQQGRLLIFPYSFQEKYKRMQIKVYYDSDGWGYVIHQGRKLFFPKKWNTEKIKSYYNTLLAEQDPRSPHCYFTDSFVFKGGVFVDIGCAEAMTSLECVEKASCIYLFECNEEWIGALNKTFAPFKSKVHIIRKFVADSTEGDFIRLDDILSIEKLKCSECMIKMDIEGYEAKALRGARKILEYDKLKLACCIYHRKEDEIELVKIIKEAGFNIEISKGYMLLYYRDKLGYPYFRKVLVRASK